MKTDAIFRSWSRKGLLNRLTRQTGARAVVREFENLGLNVVWGLKPAYAPVVIRRTANGRYRRDV